MIYATSFSAVYKLTNKDWTRFLESKSKGNDFVGLDNYGTSVGIIEIDASDLTKEQAQDELDKFKERKLC